MNSLAYLKETVDACGATLEIDDTAYRVTAPDGYCFEPGLHELVASFARMDMTKQEARQDLILRIQCYKPLQKCVDANCEWCVEKETVPA